MKQLILLRHAKSSWANHGLDDFDRPLNNRGKRNALALGDYLRTSDVRPEHVLSSSARRTRETWAGLHLEGTPEFRDDLYLAPALTLLSALRSATASSVLVIAHNPGIAALAHMLVAAPPDHPRFGDFPTGSLLIAEANVGSFSDLQPHMARVQEFLTPHDLPAPDA